MFCMASDTANLIVCSSKPQIMPYIFNFMMVFLSKTAVALCFFYKRKSMANSTLIYISQTDISPQTDVFLLLATDVIKIHLYHYLIFLWKLTLFNNGKKKNTQKQNAENIVIPSLSGDIANYNKLQTFKKEAKIPDKPFSLLEKKTLTVSRNQILKDLGIPLQLKAAQMHSYKEAQQ